MNDPDSVTCVWNLCCPECGRDDAIDLRISTWARLRPDGTDIAEAMVGDHEWDEGTDAVCQHCDHLGIVAGFRPKGAP